MKAIALTDKAIRQIILALRGMKYNTEAERAYRDWLVKQIREQTEE